MSEPIYQNAPPADFVLPFDLPEAGVRGRLVRLSLTVTQALSVQDVPECVGRVEGECMALVAMLGSLLKLDGRLTVQTKSNGPLGMVVADYYGAEAEKPRGMRATVRLDREMLSAYGTHPSFSALVGKGALAITVRPRVEAKDYQGVVALAPEGLSAAAETYFEQSEQLTSKVVLAAAPVFTRGQSEPAWYVGGILVQATPDAVHGPEDWERISTLAATTAAHELVDVGLPAETLLWRLFHQEDVRLLPFEPVSFRCDCNIDNIAAVLQSYPAEERQKLADPDGFIRAKCEFCGSVHAIPV